MALLKALCWALIFILRIRFPPGSSIATVFLINCSKTMFTHIDHNIDLPDRCLGLPGQYVGLPGGCHGQSSFESLTDADTIYSPCRHL